MRFVWTLKDWACSINRKINEVDTFTLLGSLTLILLLIHSHEYWYTKTPIVILAIVGLVYRKALSDPLMWLMISAFIGVANFYNWYIVDNHKYLIGYWCIACFLACLLPQEARDEVLSLNARRLIGLCMAFSVFSKITSPSYMDGSFFHYTMISDNRFSGFANRLSGLHPALFSDNQEKVRYLQTAYYSGEDIRSVVLNSSVTVRNAASLLTWWTLLIEGALAVLFLKPDKKASESVRSILLIIFALTTYSVATVQGFGWILLIMGIAQTSVNNTWMRTVFVVTILILQLYMMPISDFANYLAGGGSRV